MVLNDWKKKNRKGIMGWSKKQGSFWQGIYIYHNKFWEVEIIDFNDDEVNSPVILDTSYFKTEEEAIGFAMNYMKHN